VHDVGDYVYVNAIITLAGASSIDYQCRLREMKIHYNNNK